MAFRRSFFRLSSFVFRPTVLLCIGVLVCWLTLLPPQAQVVDVGSDGSELAYLGGAYQRERTDGGTTFRWVSGNATLFLPAGHVGTTLLEARLHGAPDLKGGTLPLTLTLGTGQRFHLAIPESERVYRIPVPTGADGALRATISGATVVAPGDNRAIAFALDRIGLRPIDPTVRPAWPIVAEQGLLLASVLALLAALRLPLGWRLLAGALLIAALATLNLSLRLWIGAAALPLALAALILAVLTRWVHSPQRHKAHKANIQNPLSLRAFVVNLRLLWAIVIGGAAIRLLGVLAPGFEAHDLDIQGQQFAQVATGLLYFTVHSHEWAGAATFYPPGPYVLLLPLLTLLPSVATTLHVGAALVDAAGPLLLALIARRLGASERAALLAALLLAALPIQFTALWWGFFTNTIGQFLVLLLLWAMLEYEAAPSRRRRALVALVAALVLLSHAGVLAMAGVLVTLVVGYVWIGVRQEARGERRTATTTALVTHHSSLSTRYSSLTFTLLAVALAVALLYFSVIVAPMVVEAFTIADTRSERDPARSAAFRAYIIDIQPVKLWRGLLGYPALLLLPGLLLLWRRVPSALGRGLLLAWPLVPLLFFVAELVLLVQVRYVFFAAPLCALALAVFLDRIPPSRAGRFVVCTIVLMIVATGSILWLDGALLGDKLSLVPLTH